MVLKFFLFFLLTISLLFSSNKESYTLGSGNSFEPFFIKKHDGTIEGYDKEIVELINKKTNSNISIDLDQWKKQNKRAESGELDGLATAANVSTRAHYCTNSKPYLTLSSIVFVKKRDKHKYNSIKDLEGKIGAFQSGNLLFEDLLKGENIEFQSLYSDSIHGLLKKVASNEADFTVVDETAYYLMAQLGLSTLLEGTFAVGEPFEVVFCIRNEKKELLEKINEGISHISQQEILKLRKKWFLTNVDNRGIVFSPEELLYLKNHPVLTVQNEKDWKPFNYNLDGVPMGHSVDFMKLLASKIGVEVNFIQDRSWKDYLDMLKNGELDLIVNIAKTPEREKYFNYTSEYNKVLSSLFVRDDSLASYNSLDDLNGKTVSVVKGMVGEFVLQKNYPQIELYPVKTSLDALKAVIYGKVDGVVQSNVVGSQLMNQYDIKNLKPIFEINDPQFNMHLHLATNKNNTILRDILEKGKNSITQKELLALKKKHFSQRKVEKSSLLSDEAINYIKKLKTLEICISPKSLPFNENRNGKYIGIGGEYLNQVNKHFQIPVNIVKTKNWDESLQFAKRGKCTLIPFIAETKERREYLEFTNTYLDIPIVLAVHGDTSFIDDVKNLSRKKVAIIKSYAYKDILKKNYPHLEIVEVSSIEVGMEMLQQKRIFAYIDLLASITYYANKNFIEDIKIGGKLDEKISIKMASTKERSELVSILNTIIENISEETHQEILSKWIKVKYEQPIDYKLIRNIVIVFLVVLGFVVYRQYLLRKNNELLQKKVNQEIAKSRKKDNLIFQQNKMASLGDMVGAIAHQWKQPLSHLSISTSVLLKITEDGEIDKNYFQENLSDSMKTIRFMSDTINDFQKFYENNQHKREFFVSESIEDVLTLIKESLRLGSIEVEKDVDDSISINANKNLLSQVILTIVQNSLFFLSKRSITDPKITIEVTQRGSHILLKILDNAGGVPEAYLSKVFDYNFSYRDDEKTSTGIGLYVSKLIVEEKFKGRIKAENQEGGLQLLMELPTTY